MQQSFSLPLFLAFLVGSSAQFTPVSAQVTPDGSTSTTVNVDDNKVEINDGNRAGGNLFHSFREFSIPTGGEASFNNPDTIENIFSRVTGGNTSNIDGLIRTNDASLFLINPAGIIFGAGARLDLGGGSFYGSSADSILFEDGEFSATDLDNPPLLTINAPIGLGFRVNPNEVQLKEANLEVNPNQNITLVGGNVNLEGATLTAPGGRIDLGGLATAGEVIFNDDGSLKFPNNIEFTDVSLTNLSQVNVQAGGGGEIKINARNLELEGQSELLAGIDENMGSSETQAGNIEINATENIAIDESSILNQVESEALGNAGDISLNATESILISNASVINSTLETNAEGNAGNIKITTGDFQLVGEAELFDTPTETRSLDLPEKSSLDSRTLGRGNAGDIEIGANHVSIANAFIRALTFKGAVGDAGDVNINASETVSLTQNSFIINQVEGVGNAGDVRIGAKDFTIDDASFIVPNTIGIGNAGNIEIDVENFSLANKSFLVTNAESVGDGGNIIINASNSVFLDEIFIFSQLIEQATSGNPGNIEINTGNLVIQNGSLLVTGTQGQENSGNIEINANNFELTSGGKLITGTGDSGSAGNIVLNIRGDITLDGNNPVSLTLDFDPFDNPILTNLETASGLFANTTTDSIGNGGNIKVNTTGRLNIINEAQISVASQGQGNGGEISIKTDSLNLDNQASINAATVSGSGGNIDLTISETVTLSENSFISARAFNDANGGNITIDADFIIAFPSQSNGNDIFASSESGQGGNINITAQSIFNLNERKVVENNGTNDLDASSDFGLDGSVSINTPDVDAIQGASELPSNVVEPEQTVTQTCQSDLAMGKVSGLVVKGKGGIPPEPTAPMDSDAILVDGKIINLHPQVQSLDIKPVKTSIGDIYPARGIMVSELGEIILTAFPTDSIDRRTPQIKANCIH